MKSIKALLLFLFFANILCAQNNKGFSYKAVLSDNGEVKKNENVAVLFSILNKENTIVYQESHITTTDDSGIITLVIGEGNTEVGSFTSIDWGEGSYYLKTEIDGVVIGTTRFYEVPYAKYAQTAKDGVRKLDDLSDVKSNGSSVFIGTNAGESADENASNNIVLGEMAGQSITTGSHNILIGQKAGQSITTGNNNVIIGGRSQGDSSDNAFNLSNSSGVSLISGRFVEDLGGNPRYVYVHGDLFIQERLLASGGVVRRRGIESADMTAYMYGYVNADGTIQSRSSSEGFLVIKLDTGDYKVSFIDPSSDSPNSYNEYIVVVSRSSAGFVWSDRFDSYFKVATTNSSGDRADRSFSFVVYKKW